MISLVLFVVLYTLSLSYVKNRKILFVGISGLRVDCVSNNTTPAILSVSLDGRYGLNNKAVYPCEKEVNYATMLTGVLPQTHGVRDSYYLLNNLDEYPSIFYDLSQVVRKKKKITILTHTWNNLGKLFSSTSDSTHVIEDDETIKDISMDLIKNDIDLDILSIFFGELDRSAKREGGYYCFKNKNYLETLTRIDSYFFDILQILNERIRKSQLNKEKIEEEWLIILTSSNGGRYATDYFRNEETCSRFLITSQRFCTFKQICHKLRTMTKDLKSTCHLDDIDRTFYPNLVANIVYDFLGLEIPSHFDLFVDLFENNVDKSQFGMSDWILFPWNDMNGITRWIFMFLGIIFMVSIVDFLFCLFCTFYYRKKTGLDILIIQESRNRNKEEENNFENDYYNFYEKSNSSSSKSSLNEEEEEEDESSNEIRFDKSLIDQQLILSGGDEDTFASFDSFFEN